MPKYKNFEITESKMQGVAETYATSRRRLLELIRYWEPRGGSKFDRTVPDFGKTPEGLYTGAWHRKLKDDDILFMAYVLRYQYCTGTAFTNYELDFIQGMEDMVRNNKKRNNKQGWQLAMLLIEKVM